MERQNLNGPSASAAQPMLKSKASKQDAVSFLIDNHRKVRSLFKVIDHMKSEPDGSDRMELVRKVCTDLLVHMAVEESIFYPALNDHLHHDGIIDHAVTDHENTRALIMQLVKIEIANTLFESRVRALSAYVDEHFQEEEGEMFLEARKADIDLAALGQELKDATELMRAHYGRSVRGDSGQREM